MTEPKKIVTINEMLNEEKEGRKITKYRDEMC